MKNLFTSFCFIIFIGNMGVAQTAPIEKPPLYIDILIDPDKVIYLENNIIRLDELSSQVSQFIHNQPTATFEKAVYRIYGDKTLFLGYISDVQEALIKGYGNKVRFEKYLINLEKRGIDGSNYIRKLEKLDLKAID